MIKHKRTSVPRRCAAVGALLGALWIVPTAGAATPQRFTLDFQESDTIDCSEFNPAWNFDDDFTDFFHIEATVFSDVNGNPLRATSLVGHTSNDVNSVSGFTLHEHNDYVMIEDFVAGTITQNGAINIMQRRGVGSVIQNVGHKVSDGETGEPVTLAGPNKADDSDFCGGDRAIAAAGTERTRGTWVPAPRPEGD